MSGNGQQWRDMAAKVLVVTALVLLFVGGGLTEVAASPASQPGPLAGKVIAIDAGHGIGSKNVGSTGPTGLLERDVTLEVAKSLRDFLRQDEAKVIMTREGKNDVAFEERVSEARKNGADIFVSIHTNGSEADVKGTETFIYDYEGKLFPAARNKGGGTARIFNGNPLEAERRRRDASYRLASKVQAKVSKTFGRLNADRGVKSDTVSQLGELYVLRYTRMPAILVELAFITNPEEEKLLRDYAAWAKALREGILEYFAGVSGSPQESQPKGQKAVVFVQGIKTTLEGGKESTFDRIKASLMRIGYTQDDFLEFGYNGGRMDGAKWLPKNYGPCDPGKEYLKASQRLREMLASYRKVYPNVSFVLVGHSLGGRVAFEAARDLVLSPNYKVGTVSTVITLDAPLGGVRFDLETIIIGQQVTKWDILPKVDVDFNCWFGEAVPILAVEAEDRSKENTSRLNYQSVERLKKKGVKVVTLGSAQDCILDPMGCGTFGDTVRTQVVVNASQHKLYNLGFNMLNPPESHGRILQDDGAVADIVAIIGPPEVTIVTPGSATGNTATILVMDISNSMNEKWRGGVKIAAAKAAAAGVIDMIEQDAAFGKRTHMLGITAFRETAATKLELSNDYAAARSAISALSADGNTNLGDGLEKALDQLKGSEVGFEKIIILLTDGNTNRGMSREEIVKGPVQQAAAGGVCIYPVGFGDAGNLDEAFLRQIAVAAGCGEYYYAEDAAQLEAKYVKIRHQSAGNVVAEFAGRIAQGETRNIGEVTVPGGQSELHATLNWPGSVLRLELVDPEGAVVNEGYRGANIAFSPRMVYVIVENPKEGRWSAKAYGVEVSGTSASYSAIFSVRPSPPMPMTPLLLIAVSLLGAVGILFLTRQLPFREVEAEAAPTKICPYCQSVVSRTVSFCPACGAKIE